MDAATTTDLPVPSTSIDTGEGRIAYELIDLSRPWLDRGPRLPIIFQHGLGLCGAVWRPWVPQLSRQGRFALVDLRGYAGSADAWLQTNYPMKRFGDDVIAVADQLGFERFHFIGESFGGTLGMFLGIEQPDRVASVTISSTAFNGEHITNVSHWPEQAETGRLEEWSEELATGRFVPGAVEPELEQWVRRWQMSVAPEVVAGTIRTLLGENLTDPLRTFPVPLLILAPSGSPFVDVTRQVELKNLVPESEIVFLRGARHGIAMSHSYECSTAAAAFITRCETLVPLEGGGN